MNLLSLFEKFQDEPLPQVGTPGGRVNPPVGDGRGAPEGADSTLRQSGWTRIGQGAYGSAYTHQSKPGWVMKVFWKDPAYIRFYSLAKRSQNPHFPEVSRMEVMSFPSEKGPVSVYAVLVELLGRYRGQDEAIPYQLSKFSAIYLGGREEFFAKQARQSAAKEYWNTKKLVQLTWPKWIPALDEIRGVMQRGSYVEDTHTGNIRWREGVYPVLIDPLYYGGE